MAPDLQNSKYMAIDRDPNTGEWYGITHSGVIEKFRPPRSFRPKPSTMEKVGKGMTDIGAGAKQAYLYHTDPEAYGEYTAQRDQEIGDYQQARAEAGDTGIDWPALGGEAVATSFLGPMNFGRTLVGKTASGALQGSAATGLMYTPESERGFGLDRGINAGIGALGGGAVPPMLSGAKSVIARGATGAVNALNSLRATITPDVSIRARIENAGFPEIESLGERVQASVLADARRQLENTGSIDADALRRRVQAEELGFAGDKGLTTGQVTRDARLWGREQDIAKMEGGEPLRTRFTAQQRRLTSELREELPRSTVAVSDMDSAVIQSVNDKWDDMQLGVSKVYDMIENRYGDATVDDGLPTFRAWLDDAADDPQALDLVNAARNRGEKIGLFGEDQQPVTLRNIEQFRKWLNRRSDKNEPELRRLKRIMIDQLDDAVIDTFGDDVFRVAREKARERFAEFGGNLVKKITEGKIDDGKLYQRAMGSSPQDLEQLKYVLTTEYGGRDYSEAWEALRSAVLDNVWKRAAPEGEDGLFRQASFRNELERIGEKKLKILFPNEYETLQRIRETARDISSEPPYSGVNYSQSAPSIFNLLSRVPVMGEYTQGVQNAARQSLLDFDVSRAMESQPAPRLSLDEVVANMEALGQRPLGRLLHGALKPGGAYGGLLGMGALRDEQ